MVRQLDPHIGLGDGQVDLAGFDQRLAERLDLVDRRLAAGDAVLREEQAFAPKQSLATDAQRDRGAGDGDAIVDVGVSQLDGAAEQVGGGAGKFLVRHRDRVEGGGRRVRVRQVIDLVVPAIGADLGAELAPRDVELARHVDPFGVDPPRERPVAVVGVAVGEQRGVARLETEPQRTPQGRVEADIEPGDRP